MFSDHNRIKFRINNRKIAYKIPKYLKINDTLLNNPQIKEEITREIRKYFELN